MWKLLQNKAKLFLGLVKCYIEIIFKYKKEAHPEETEAEPTSEKDLMKNPDDISENGFSWKESSISSINWYPW